MHKHTHERRHICSLLIKGKEKTLSKYKVAQGRFDLPCWVLQTFRTLFVQLGKCIKLRMLVCASSALKAQLSQVPPRPHCWCHLLNTLVQGENQQVTFCSAPPDVQKSIDRHLKATISLKNNRLLLCPAPAAANTPEQPSAQVWGRAPEQTHGHPTQLLAEKLRHHLSNKKAAEEMPAGCQDVFQHSLTPFFLLPP